MGTKRLTLAAAAPACLLLLAALVPGPAGGQQAEKEVKIVQCICVTTTREEPITILGIQVGSRTVTETQCWYE